MSFYSETYEIMIHDVDAKDMLRPTAIARILQETANHQMRDRRPTYHELFEEGKSYILIRFAVQVYRAIVPYEKVRVNTWTCPSKGATFKRNYNIFIGDELVVEAASEWAIVDRFNGKIYGVKDLDISNYEEDEPLELTIPVKFHVPFDLELEPCGEKLIGYSDCDMNGHMNNTRYYDILWDMVPDVQNKVLTGFSIRFMAAGMLGKTMEIHRAKSPQLVEDGAGGEETWYFKTRIEGNTNVEAMLNFKESK